MTLRHAFALLLVSVALLTPVDASDQVDRLIPADAGIAGAIRDLPATSAAWADSPLARLWDDPAMRAYFAPLHRKLQEESLDDRLLEETGYTSDELVAMAPGGVAFYFRDFATFMTALDADPDGLAAEDVDAAVLIGAGESAEEVATLIQELIERDAEDAEDTHVPTTREYREITMHIQQRIDLDEPRDEGSWAVVDGVVAVSSNPDHLQTIIDRVLDGDDSGLLTSDDPAIADLAANDAYLFVDIAPYIPLLEESLATEFAVQNPAGLDATRLVEALGLNALRSATMSLDMDGGMTQMDMVITMSENVGLMKMMAFENRPIERVEGIPAHAENFGVNYFSIETCWTAIEEMVNAINPMYLAMASGQLAGWQEAQGLSLDLRRDLLENIGSTIVSLQFMGDVEEGVEDLDAMEDQVVIFEVLDSEALTNLIETLKSGVSQGNELFESREFLGVEIHTLKETSPDAATPRIAYAVTDQHLYLSVGAGRSLEETLAARANPDAPSAWDQPDVIRALAAIPGNVASMNYQDTGAMSALLFEVMSFVAMDTTEDDLIFDPAAVPTPEVIRQYLGPIVSFMSKDDTSIQLRAVVLSSEDAS
jgi:hypothetical protein